VSANGKRRPPRPRIEVLSSVASESEAAAIVAGVEQFLADTAPAPPADAAPQSRWQRAALLDGISARNLGADIWGQNG
jgi:hypothetical protein